MLIDGFIRISHFITASGFRKEKHDFLRIQLKIFDIFFVKRPIISYYISKYKFVHNLINTKMINVINMRPEK